MKCSLLFHRLPSQTPEAERASRLPVPISLMRSWTSSPNWTISSWYGLPNTLAGRLFSVSVDLILAYKFSCVLHDPRHQLVFGRYPTPNTFLKSKTKSTDLILGGSDGAFHESVRLGFTYR